MGKLYGAVEIGGTKQQLAIVDENGGIVELVCGKFPLPNGAIDVLNWIEANFPALLQKYSVEAIGVGYGGILESKTGRVLLSVQVPGWQDFMLKDWFEKKFSIRTVVVNDTVCGGYAEYMLGSGRGYQSFYYTNTSGLVPVCVMAVSAIVMMILGLLSKKLKKAGWLSDYALPISLLVGMASAIPFVALFGGEVKL